MYSFGSSSYPWKWGFRALCLSKAGQDLGLMLLFSFYSLRSIRCFQAGSIFTALHAWICLCHFPCGSFKTSWPLSTRQPSEGMHFFGICTRNALGRTVGDPWGSLPCLGQQLQGHSEVGLTTASLSGGIPLESLRNHLHSLAFKLLTKHNALPRKACLLLTWKLIYEYK